MPNEFTSGREVSQEELSRQVFGVGHLPGELAESGGRSFILTKAFLDLESLIRDFDFTIQNAFRIRNLIRFTEAFARKTLGDDWEDFKKEHNISLPRVPTSQTVVEMSKFLDSAAEYISIIAERLAFGREVTPEVPVSLRIIGRGEVDEIDLGENTVVDNSEEKPSGVPVIEDTPPAEKPIDEEVASALSGAIASLPDPDIGSDSDADDNSKEEGGSE